MNRLSALVPRITTSLVLCTIFFIGIIVPSCWPLTSVLTILALYTLIVEWPPLATNSLLWLLTPIYPLTPFCMLIGMSITGYRSVIAFIFITVATFDTAAYVGGSLFGTHRLAPTISPGKTQEGALCGLSGVTVVLLLYRSVYMPTLSGIPLFFLSGIISALALYGDLFESWLKRRAHLKDSGYLLPGHGGVLDRFDSILWVTYCIFFIKNYFL